MNSRSIKQALALLAVLVLVWWLLNRLLPHREHPAPLPQTQASSTQNTSPPSTNPHPAIGHTLPEGRGNQRVSETPQVPSPHYVTPSSQPSGTPSAGHPSGEPRKRRGGLDHEAEWWGYRCGILGEKDILIKEDDEWDKFRARFQLPSDWRPEKSARDPRLRKPPPVLPDIDFDKMMVIGVFLGRVQEGYRIEISTAAIDPGGKTMNVNYGKSFPLPNPMSGTALNEPYDIMVIRRFNGDVYFWNKP
jgi:hypothetical protein